MPKPEKISYYPGNQRIENKQLIFRISRTNLWLKFWSRWKTYFSASEGLYLFIIVLANPFIYGSWYLFIIFCWFFGFLNWFPVYGIWYNSEIEVQFRTNDISSRSGVLYLLIAFLVCIWAIYSRRTSVNVLFGQRTFWVTHFCPDSFFFVWFTDQNLVNVLNAYVPSLARKQAFTVKRHFSPQSALFLDFRSTQPLNNIYWHRFLKALGSKCSNSSIRFGSIRFGSVVCYEFVCFTLFENILQVIIFNYYRTLVSFLHISRLSIWTWINPKDKMSDELRIRGKLSSSGNKRFTFKNWFQSQ